MYPTHYD